MKEFSNPNTKWFLTRIEKRHKNISMTKIIDNYALTLFEGLFQQISSYHLVSSTALFTNLTTQFRVNEVADYRLASITIIVYCQQSGTLAVVTGLVIKDHFLSVIYSTRACLHLENSYTYFWQSPPFDSNAFVDKSFEPFPSVGHFRRWCSRGTVKRLSQQNQVLAAATLMDQ